MKVREAKMKYETVGDIDCEQLDSPEKTAAYIKAAIGAKEDFDPTVEQFSVLILNQKHYPLGLSIITKGTATQSLVHPREVYKPAILAGASAIVITHNHPSGDTYPSTADRKITGQIRDAGKVLDIRVLDHIITGDDYYSFMEQGLI